MDGPGNVIFLWFGKRPETCPSPCYGKTTSRFGIILSSQSSTSPTVKPTDAAFALWRKYSIDSYEDGLPWSLSIKRTSTSGSAPNSMKERSRCVYWYWSSALFFANPSPRSYDLSHPSGKSRWNSSPVTTTVTRNLKDSLQERQSHVRYNDKSHIIYKGFEEEFR